MIVGRNLFLTIFPVTFLANTFAPAAPPRRRAPHHPVLATPCWTIGLAAVLAPLALRAFNRRTRQ